MLSTFSENFDIIDKMIWSGNMKQRTILKLSMVLIFLAFVVNVYVYYMSRLESPVFLTHRYEKTWKNAIWQEVSLYYITNVGNKDSIKKIILISEDGTHNIETEGLKEIVLENYGMYEIRQIKTMCPVQGHAVHIQKIKFETQEGKIEQVDIGYLHFRTPSNYFRKCEACDVCIKQEHQKEKEYYQITANETVMFTHIEPTLPSVQLELMTEQGEEIKFPFTLEKGKTIRCYLDLADMNNDNHNTTIFEIEPRLVGIRQDGTQIKQDFNGILQKVTNGRILNIYSILEEKGAL